MFFAGDRGGRVAATMFTLLKSAQRNDLNPFDCMTDVLTRIADHRRHQVAELLLQGQLLFPRGRRDQAVNPPAGPARPPNPPASPPRFPPPAIPTSGAAAGR